MQTFERTAWCSLIQIIAFKGDPIGRKVFSGHFTQALTISIIMMRIINTRYSLKKTSQPSNLGLFWYHRRCIFASVFHLIVFR